MDKIEYRAVIKFIVKEGLKPNKIHSKFRTQTLPRWSAFFFESRGDCSCRGVFCRSYEEPLQGQDNGAEASLE
jgi:hypothetical protein